MKGRIRTESCIFAIIGKKKGQIYGIVTLNLIVLSHIMNLRLSLMIHKIFYN